MDFSNVRLVCRVVRGRMPSSMVVESALSCRLYLAQRSRTACFAWYCRRHTGMSPRGNKSQCGTKKKRRKKIEGQKKWKWLDATMPSSMGRKEN
jgi:hypothetical protein